MFKIESLKGRDLTALSDLSQTEFADLLESALEIKKASKLGIRPELLKQKTLAMIFEKPSLRTRSTFDIGMYQLGGYSILLDQKGINLGVRETIKDVAHNLERWYDGIMARTFAHSTIIELAQEADIPVINGLSDLTHPCQLMADYLTMKEEFGELKGLKVAFVGDGNNMANSHINAAVLAGTELTIACPEGYEPDMEIVENARAQGANIKIDHGLKDAVVGADVLYTDVWVSMGQEEEAKARKKAFKDYTITPDWFELLSDRGIFMHDLPAHYGEECVQETVYHPQSRVFPQAENRLHAQKAVLYQIMG